MKPSSSFAPKQRTGGPRKGLRPRPSSKQRVLGNLETPNVCPPGEHEVLGRGLAVIPVDLTDSFRGGGTAHWNGTAAKWRSMVGYANRYPAVWVVLKGAGGTTARPGFLKGCGLQYWAKGLLFVSKRLNVDWKPLRPDLRVEVAVDDHIREAR